MTLEQNNVHFMYHQSAVLDGISITVNEGEVLGVLGPNGCGKTTLMKNLNRNISPKQGTVVLDGISLEEIIRKDVAKKIATVPQGNEIRFAFTVEDIVQMGRIPFQKQLAGESSEDKKIIVEALEETKLTPLKDKFIGEISGGERQRTIIARALAQTPKFLLMDEPTNHLDINMQFEILDLVHGLSRSKGIGVVIVSHDLPMATRYCDRVALIKNGKIYALGKPEEVLTKEAMKEVFYVDAELGKDPKTGKQTVLLHGAVPRNNEK